MKYRKIKKALPVAAVLEVQQGGVWRGYPVIRLVRLKGAKQTIIYCYREGGTENGIAFFTTPKQAGELAAGRLATVDYWNEEKTFYEQAQPARMYGPDKPLERAYLTWTKYNPGSLRYDWEGKHPRPYDEI